MTIQVKKQSKSPQNIVSIILAAGKGTRMRSPDRAKVCFTVNGKPVILRIVETLGRLGIYSHLAVIGVHGEQVIRALDPVQEHMIYCRQKQQLGTGHAAKIAARLLQDLQFDGYVLLTAGDKVFAPDILKELIACRDDLTFLVGDIRDFPGAGRVIYINGRPVEIFEYFDGQKLKLFHALSTELETGEIPASRAKNLILSCFTRPGKAARALGDLYTAVMNNRPVTRTLIEITFQDMNGRTHLTRQTLQASRHANLSVYLFRAKALYRALASLSLDNAQQEEYLTDVVRFMSDNRYSLSTLEIASPQQVMAYNTPEELEEIRTHYAG